jgi:putative ABC transport system permease protein
VRPSFRVLFEGVRIAYSGLLANKLRTFLTLLGNIVGIMSVIAVVSLLGGIDTYMRQEVMSEGSNLFTIRRVNYLDAIEDFEKFTDKLLHNPKITRGDVVALREQLKLASYVSGYNESSANLSAFGKSVNNIEIQGRDAVYPFIEKMPLATGRHLTEIDDQENSQTCVIGWEVYTALIAPRDAMGRTIKIGTKHFKVVGVIAERGRVLGNSRDRFVIIPIGAFRKVFGPEQSTSIKIAATDIRQLDAAI